MENQNLDGWNKLSTPPPNVLKKITGGRLGGMTDIKPQWRYQIMTETYGPCGVGWKFSVIKKWSEPASDGQVFAFVDIDLFIKVGSKWSDAIPGNGGSMLLAKEKNGLHSSDEAYKMATTDALSTAMKMLGVAADIYLGNWDGSKYTNQKDITPTPAKKTGNKRQADNNPDKERYKQRLEDVTQYGIVYTKKCWDQTPEITKTQLGQEFKNWLFSKAENAETQIKQTETENPIDSLKGKVKPAEKLNPLHVTPEWEEWLDLVKNCPEIKTQLPEPVDVGQCVEAVKKGKLIVDQQNV